MGHETPRSASGKTRRHAVRVNRATISNPSDSERQIWWRYE